MFLADIFKHIFVTRNGKQTSIEFLLIRTVSKLENILDRNF